MRSKKINTREILEGHLAHSKQSVSCYDVRALSVCLSVCVSVCLSMLTHIDLPNHMQVGALESAVCVSVCGRRLSLSPVFAAQSPPWRMRANVPLGWGRGGAGRKRLPPGPGQLDFSQPSDSVPLNSQAARQEGEGVDPPRGCPGPVLESSLA